MNLIAEAVYLQPQRNATIRRVLLTLGFITAFGIAACLVIWAVGLEVPTSRAPRSPFGTGIQESVSRDAFGRLVLDGQAYFYRAMTDALQRVRQGGASGLPLLLVGFCYGVFHAAGPGHGKSVVASFLLGGRPVIRTSLMLCTAAALVQSFVAIGIVGLLAVLLRMSALSISRSTSVVELVSFAAISAYGLWMTWARTAGLRFHHHGEGDHLAGHNGNGSAGCLACRHATFSGPQRRRAGTTTGFIVVTLAAGLRPCSGAIILLVFALSQNIFPLGVLSVFAMAAGTACTTIACALAAVSAKRLALQLISTRHRAWNLIPAFETALGAAVFWLGVSLLSGWRQI